MITPIDLKGHTRDVSCVKFNRDGDLVLTGSKDGLIQAWYSKDGTHLGSYRHSGAVSVFDISARSQYLLSATTASDVHMFELETGRQLAKFGPSGVIPIIDCTWLIGDQHFAYITASNTKKASTIVVHKWDPENPQESTQTPINTIIMTDDIAAEHGLGSFRRIASILPDGTILVAHDNGHISRWNAYSGDFINSVQLDKGALLTSITLSADRGLALITSRSSSAFLIKVSDFSVVKTFASDRPLNCGALSPIRSHALLAGGQDKHEVTTSSAEVGGFQIQFWHTAFTRLLTSVELHYGPVNSLSISRDGKSFVSGGEDGNVYLFHFDEAYLKDNY